jgi:hypothetical protein
MTHVRKVWALSLILSMSAISAAQGQTTTRPLTVIELFTSQGCSSCPPANANLAAIAQDRDILALSFGVTYWDYLGWRDTFANPAYTGRQHDYARGLSLPNVFTPQMVINGRISTVGNRIGELNRTIRTAPRLSTGPNITANLQGISFSATAQQTAPATIWLVRYDPRIIQVPIQRGENGGKTLPHINVVRELTRLGSYTGAAQTLRLAPSTNPALKTAILIQSSAGGPLIGAAKL